MTTLSVPSNVELQTLAPQPDVTAPTSELPDYSAKAQQTRESLSRAGLYPTPWGAECARRMQAANKRDIIAWLDRLSAADLFAVYVTVGNLCEWHRKGDRRNGHANHDRGADHRGAANGLQRRHVNGKSGPVANG